MAMTIKAVRRNNGNCICPGSLKDKNYDDGTCKKGYCYSAKCRVCGGEVFGMGPVACPCEHPRWCRYPGMEALGYWDLEKDRWISVSIAVKPSLLRRGSRRNH
jgi:hypothetical protein